MVFQIVLAFLFWSCCQSQLALAQNGPWTDPYLILTPEAEAKLVTVSSDSNNVNLRMPEELEQDFILGKLSVQADNGVSLKCRQIVDSISSEVPSIFTIDDESLQLRIARQIDFEGLEDDFEKFLCELTPDPCQTGNGCGQDFIIEIKNINDNVPRFETTVPPTIALEENKEFPDPILNIIGSDLDLLGELQCRFSTESSPFQIVSGTKSGSWNVILTETLDFEQQRSYQLDIQLLDTKDEAGVQNNETRSVYVRVEDKEDTPPTWIRFPSLVSINEDSKEGEELFEVFAVDGDSLEAVIQYEIYSITNEGLEEDHKEILRIDKDGKVFLNKEVDRETLNENNIFEVTFQATETDCSADDHNNCSNKNATTSLRILDIDDNPPYINAVNTTLTIPENYNGFLLFEPEVVIKDDDYDTVNAKFNIKIEHEEQAFLDSLTYRNVGIQSETLLIWITSGETPFLDRESFKETKFNLTVEPDTASNGLQREPIQREFTLFLEDVNDNDPVFSQENYTVNIYEDLTLLELDEDENYILIKDNISASDKDSSDAFGQASLRFDLRSNLPIEIDELSGTVKLIRGNSPFDFEGTQTFEIPISVQDSIIDGIPMVGSRLTNSILHINVLDVNDETPQFVSEAALNYCLYENNPNTWPNDPCEGEDPLAFEIKAADEDSLPNLVLDIDWEETVGRKDNREVSKDLYEDCFTVETSKSPKGQEVTGYVKEVPDSWIDREKVDQISLVIKVTDQSQRVGKNFSLLTMNIDIIDLNDSPPEFVRPDSWKFFVDELEEGSPFQPDEQFLLQRILISDPDIDQTFVFTIKGDEQSDGLIDILVEPDAPNEGILAIHNKIDREALGDEGVLKYMLTVNDANQNVQSIDINVTVRDLNDCTPVFDQEEYAFYMQEGESEEGKTFQVHATDGDTTDPFKTVFYPNLRPDYVPFEINRKTGEISIRCPEDFEGNESGNDDCIDFEIQKSFQFTAYASDNEGGVSNTGSVYVTVNIRDDNDNPPIIDSNASKVVKPNDLNPAQPLFNYVATDADSESNGKVRFSVGSYEGDDFPFEVDPSGELTATKRLDNPQVNKVFKFKLVATDLGEEALSDELDCEIEIIDVNDKTPQFTFPASNKTLYVPDDLNIGPLLNMEGGAIVIEAVDEDVYEAFKTVNYKLLNSEEDLVASFFKIDPISGAVLLKQPIENFELEDYELINLEIRAYDNPEDENNQKKSETTLKVKPTRNTEPYFEDLTPVEISFKEGPGPVDNLEQIPLQEGVDDNGEIFDDDICYFIPDPDMQKIFTLGVDTNKIQVISPLDHETKPTSYNFLIITTNKCVNMPDLEDVEVKSRLNLTVKVDDINDVVPRFDRDPIFEGIFVDDDQTWMKTISVVDPDEMDNTFTFDMGPIAVSSDNTGLDVIKDGAFELKASSGPNAMIVAKFTRQESMKGFFKFNLTVSDSGEVHSHTAEVKVVIIAPENKITLRFDNQPEEVDALDKEIKAVFEENFEGWLYTKDSSRPDTFATKNNTAGTVVECHFLDSEFDPVNQREAQAQYELVFRELTLGLANFSLTLKRENGFGTGEMGLPEDESGASTATIVLIIATALLALILVCLVVTYFIRVSNLERKVKAMGFDAFGSQASDLNRAGYNSNEGLPNTNNFASSGANPIFNIEDDIADFGNAPYQTDNPLGKNIQSAYADNGRDFDASSLGSGDSVLIGIENQAEFKNYEGQSRNISRPRFDDSDTTMDDSDFELSDLDESPRENRPHTNLFNRLDLSDAIPAPSLDLGGSPFGGGGGNPLYHSDDEN